MCDSLVAFTADGVMFAKNSDRDPNEAQLLEWVGGARHAPGDQVRCTWIEVPQAPETFAAVLSRPWWMWGAEMGANEHGVVIGNEAVFTNQPAGEPALLGMDLVRLALERASSAAGAVETIVRLLERHGQGGPCSHEHPRFTYDNSFLVADPDGAFVVETAGRHSAVEAVDPATGGRSISNGLTIAGFAEAFADRVKERFAACRPRRARTEDAARRASGPGDLMAALRDHGKAPGPRWSLVNGALGAPCAHAGGLVASTQTTASFVADLRGGAGAALHWATATAAPCTSLYKPVRIGEPADLGPEPTDRYDPASTWWRHERLHRAALADFGGLVARYRRDRDRTEAAWLATPPSSKEAFATARDLEAQWLADVLTARRRDRRPPFVRLRWRSLDAAAGMPGAVAA